MYYMLEMCNMSTHRIRENVEERVNKWMIDHKESIRKEYNLSFSDVIEAMLDELERRETVRERGEKR